MIEKELLQSERISFAEYQRFQRVIGRMFGAFPGSDIAAFTEPSAIARQAHDLMQEGKPVSRDISSQYYVDVPYPSDIAELTEGQFNKLLTIFGPDIMRAKLVSDTAITALEGGKILPVGGACMIETWGEHLLKRQDVAANPALRAQIAEEIMQQGPYYTQVTGTMLLGGEEHVGVMYREEFPWWERAEEYGVKDAKRKAHGVYDKIFAAVERRGKLIDPEFQLVGVHFDDLHLEEDGYLRARMKDSMQALPSSFNNVKPKEYKPGGYNLAWVRYTYSGSEMLHIVQKLARKQGINLDRFTLHTRTKQLDHFRAPTYMFSPSLPTFKSTEQQYAVIAGLGLDYLQLKTHEKGNGFVGFYDLTNGGDIVHQTIKVDGDKKKSSSEVREILSSPVRLSAANLAEHMQYLQSVIFSHSKEGKEVIAAAKAEKSLIAQEAALQKRKENELAYQQVEELLSRVQSTRREEKMSFISLISIDQEELLERLLGVMREKDVQKTLKKMRIPDTEQKSFLTSLLQAEVREGHIFARLTAPPQVSEEESSMLFSALSQAVIQKRQKLAQDTEGIEKLFAIRQEEFAKKFGSIDTTAIQGLLDFIPSAFPVGNNPLVTHAIQLGFDADMRQFVVDAQAIEESTLSDEEKQQRLFIGMQQIFPKIVAYLTFIMKGGEYPDTRFKQTYKSVI